MIIKVLIEISHKMVDKCFDYLVPENLIDEIRVGVRVTVPFGQMTLEGFVLQIMEDYESEYELKSITNVIDSDIILNEELLELGKYISEKTISTLISSYQVMLPRALKAKKNNNIGIKTECYIKLNDYSNYELTDKQKEIINYLELNDNCLFSEIKEINTTYNILLNKGIIEKVYKEVYRYKIENNDYIKHELTIDQKNVVNSILLDINKYSKFLLHGITGSGKTEVYMEIIEHVINSGKDAILLVPEISLTPQIVKRFTGRFKESVAVLHSSLKESEKYDEYRKIARGEVKIAIGARSCIFAPFKNLGVIIIDECHSNTYKQDNMPKYDTIDVANKRCEYNNIPLILGSATPQLEIYARSLKGIYKLLELNNRIGSSKLPSIEILDLMKEERIKKTNFTKKLYNKVIEKIEKGEQVILLLNKRGYSSIVNCKECGYTVKCPNCDIPLVYHKTKDILRCHYCGYATSNINICPICKNDSVRLLGSGTEKIEEEIKSLFKDYSLLRMDIDTINKDNTHEKAINDFGSGKYQILLGTQMIAKGLDFPNVTLVGVINADIMLSNPSFRASEETYSLLSQVSGRAGRSDKNGEVIIQTFNKDHYAINSVKYNDYKKFYLEEMNIRKINKYPPYFYILNILIKSKDYMKLSMESNLIFSILNNELDNCIILGPTVAYPFKINGVCRFNITLKYKTLNNLYNVLHKINEHYRFDSKLDIEFSFE